MPSLERIPSCCFCVDRPALGLALLVLVSAIACGSGAPKASEETDATSGPPPAEQAPTIVRDSRGVPHLYAETLADAFFALGYAQAQDRLFQMHYRRLVMRGRLAEFFAVPDTGAQSVEFNDKLIKSDKRVRVIGYSQRADRALTNLSDELSGLLQAYSDGVNAYVATQGGNLGLAFSIAGIDAFDPWVPADSVLAWDWVGWHFDGVVARMRDEITRMLDCESTDGCSPVPCEFPLDEDAAVVPPPPGGIWPPAGTSSLQAGGIRRIPVQVKASHGWVVHGSRTTTGKPALYGEPQLVLEAPSTWHEFHIDAAGINVRGVGIAGAPGVFIFRNQHIAQTVTAGGADVADLFELTLGESDDTYIIDSVEHSFTERQDEIHVRYRGTISLTVRETSIGPVVNAILDNAPVARLFAVRIASHLPDSQPSIAAGIELMRANSLNSYRDALRLWRSPTLNMLYAGVDQGDDSGSQGHIAYHTGTSIPHRADLSIDGRDFTGRYPYDGSDSSQHWGALYDLNWHPHVIDPANGYLFSGNHLPIGSWYDDVLYSGIGGIGDSFRSLRVRYALKELLPDAQAKAAPADLHGMHFDAKSEIVRGVHDMLAYLDARGVLGEAGDLQEPPTDQRQKAARILLALNAWRQRGGNLSYSDLAWPLVSRLTSQAGIKARYQQNLEFACQFNGSEGGASFAVKTFDQVGAAMITPAVVTWLLELSEAAWDQAVPLQGSTDPTAWTLPAPEAKVVKYQKNFGCLVPGQGGACSLDAQYETSMVLEDAFIHTINSAFGSSYPVSVDFSEADASQAFLPPGLSEDPASPHFDDGLAFTTRKAARDTSSMPHSTLDRSVVMQDVESLTELSR